MRRTLAILFAVLLMVPVVRASGDGAPAAPASGTGNLVTLQLKDVPVLDALAILFKGVDYTVGPIQNPPMVTAVVKEVPFSDALQVLLRASGLTARKENGVYYISQSGANAGAMICEELEKQYRDLSAKLSAMRAKGDSPEDAQDVIAVKQEMEKIEQKLLQIRSNKPVSAPQQKTLVEPELIMAVVDLRYLAVPDLAPMLMKVSGLKMCVPYGKQMIVKGTADAIAEVKRIVAQLDVASAVPKPVRVNLQVKVKVAGGKPIEFSADNVGVMGTAIHLWFETEFTAPVPGNPNAPNPSQQLSGNITPSIVDGGLVSLKGDGVLGYVIGGESISKQFDILALATPGRPVLISTGSSTVDGKLQSFEVYATVTIEDVKPATAESTRKK